MDQRATITYLVEQLGACAWYRCSVPGRALSRLGHDVLVSEAPTVERLGATHVFVLERPTQELSLRIIQHAKSLDRVTVVDLDDDYWNIHPTNPAYESWQRPDRIRFLNECIRSVDLVTVTTPRLAELTAPRNPNVAILPNMLDAADWPNDPPALDRREASSSVVLGWAGSMSHTRDLTPLAGTVLTLLDRYPALEIRIAGLAESPFPPHERISLLESVPIEEYPSLLSGFDIGIAPLVDDRFNRYKSDLKFVEYARLGIPTVASRVEPYVCSISHGQNGFLASNAKDWLKYLSRLIESPELRRSIGTEGHRFATARSIDDHAALWERAYGIR